MTVRLVIIDRSFRSKQRTQRSSILTPLFSIASRAARKMAIILLRYAQESSWREDHAADLQWQRIVAGLAMRKTVSPDFTGYWQRHISY